MRVRTKNPGDDGLPLVHPDHDKPQQLHPRALCIKQVKSGGEEVRQCVNEMLTVRGVVPQLVEPVLELGNLLVGLQHAERAAERSVASGEAPSYHADDRNARA